MTASSEPQAPVSLPVIGLAALTHGAYSGVDMQPVWNGLLTRVRNNAYDVGALMDMAIILQLTGQREQGLEAQRHALAQHRVYERAGPEGGLRLLAFVAPGDFMTNTPLDFLLEGSNITLIELYMGAGEPLPAIPEHDVAMVAIGESDSSRQLLEGLGPMLARWPKPVLNRNVKAIAAMTRDEVSALFADSQHVLSPRTARVSIGALERVAAGEPLVAPLAGMSWPWVVRPVGSHAGTQLEKIDGPEALGVYLKGLDATEAFVAPFVDYSGPDGLFRKYRVAVIDGKAYLSHLAISERWMVHYLNAGMDESLAKREEEAAAMASFDEGFAARHADALKDMSERFGLDYFAIDCGETPDGKLLLFEADVAMIIHSMDEPELYPYKGPQMKKLFAAFQAMLDRAAKA